MAEPICSQARDQLAKLAFPRTDMCNLNLRFYPRSDLKRAFTNDAINSILSCLCARCTKHLSYIGQSHLADPARRERPSDFTERVLGRNSAHSAIALFALLVHCGYPIFIIRFLERDYNDVTTIESYCRQERNINARDLEATHWPEFRTRDSSLSGQLADVFIGAMHQFAPPVMEGRDHAVYGSRRIMPFFEEELLGRGAFGDVFGFKIHYDYLRLPGLLNTANFARKQLRPGTPIETFIQERQNLDLVNQLRDRHIVQIVKSYKKGDEFNIVFPRAKANLKECLDKPPHMLGKLTTGPLREAGMWKQMRGLARALERIINYDDRNDTAQEVYQAPRQEFGDRRILGYHFDLKPANVLVYDDDDGEDNVFKISDFGQAKFREQAGGSRTTHAGGTENYAAPEMSTDEQRALNTRYDVWSLGCIFTELVTFVLKSYQGVRDFEAVRERKRGAWINYRYFDERVRRGDERRFVLRHGVREWIDNLLGRRADATEADNAFLSEIKKLLLGMLEVDVQKRYTSTRVYQELERILNQNEADGGNDIPPGLLEPAGSDSEMERNGQIIGALESFFARNTRHPGADYHHAKLQVFETYPNLELTTTIRGHSSTYRGPCRELHFVPQFALRKGYHRPLNDWDFRLITLTEPEKAADKFDYQSSETSDACTLQGFLTGHEIRKTFELKGLEYRYHREWMSRTAVSLRRHYRELLGRVGERNEENRVSEQRDLEASSDQDPSPFTLQIWREFDRQANAPPQASEEPPTQTWAPRMPLPEIEVPACRLVIFRSKKIIIIPFSDATRLKKVEDGTSSETVEVCPQRPRTQSYVVSATLVSSHQPYRDLPSIPLDLTELRRLEQKGRTDFEWVKLTFNSINDAENFRTEYLTLKRRWDDERRAQGVDFAS